MRKFLWVLPFTIILSIVLHNCSNEESITQPDPVETFVSGQIELPDNIDTEKLKIGFGGKEYLPDDNGAFELKYNPEVPGIAVVYDDESTPYFMSILLGNENGKFEINTHTTAISLAFLNPFILSTDVSEAEERISALTQLEEFVLFKNQLETKLMNNPKALNSEDNELNSSLSNLILAFLNSEYSSNKTEYLPKAKSPKDEGIIIEPVNLVSGHQLQHLGEYKFLVTNWYGRWAKCFIPNDDFYLPPNGDLVDVLLWNPLWAPSEREFEMEVVPGAPAKIIEVYGLGYENNEPWESLSEWQQNQVIDAGLLTVLVEFVPRSLSIITNTSATLGSGKIASSKMVGLVSSLFTHLKIIEKAKKYIAVGDFKGFYWELTKENLALIANDAEFRTEFIKATGIALSASAIKTLTSYVLVPLKVLFAADDLTGLAKSVLALTNSSFKSTFRVYSEDYNYGNVNGNIYDKESGSPIQGVRVELQGDKENPMNPNHVYTTDAGGGFWFENILEGKKTLVVSKNEYGSKTVEIEVSDDETTQVTIELSKGKGILTGKVLNEIFIKNGLSSTNFDKECHLDIEEIGGNNQTLSFWIYEQDNGTYSIELTPGTYKVKAWHQDYLEDEVTMTISGDMTTHAPDLILKPDCSMDGYIYINMNPDIDNSYEIQRHFDSGKWIGGGIDSDGNCYPDRNFLMINGVQGDAAAADDIQIFIDRDIEVGAHKLGESFNIECGSPYKAGVIFHTNYQTCSNENWETDFLSFWIREDPDDAICNCGITNFGTLYIDEYGKELGDVIKGKIVCDLAGFHNCVCQYDDEGPACILAQLTIDFKILRGTLYQLEF